MDQREGRFHSEPTAGAICTPTLTCLILKQSWKDVPSGPGISNGLPSGWDMVQSAVERTKTSITRHNFVPWQFHPRHSDFEPPTTSKTWIENVTVRRAVSSDGLNEHEEAYSIHVGDTGSASITANTAIGLVRALTSFMQLFYEHSEVMTLKDLLVWDVSKTFPGGHIHGICASDP